MVNVNKNTCSSFFLSTILARPPHLRMRSNVHALLSGGEEARSARRAWPSRAELRAQPGCWVLAEARAWWWGSLRWKPANYQPGIDLSSIRIAISASRSTKQAFAAHSLSEDNNPCLPEVTIATVLQRTPRFNGHSNHPAAKSGFTFLVIPFLRKHILG